MQILTTYRDPIVRPLVVGEDEAILLSQPVPVVSLRRLYSCQRALRSDILLEAFFWSTMMLE
jgi:hypothetical protein